MLNKPILARCDNRKVLAQRHPYSGEPEDWLADTYLERYGLVGLTFDFFVNWTTRSISDQLWIKRVVERTFKPWPITSFRDMSNTIYQCDGEEKVRQLCRFAGRYNFSCHYFLFRESADLQRPLAPLIEVRFDESGSVVNLQEVERSVLMNNIRQLSGGPVLVGAKGLIYALTSLECMLSKTDAAWPGDADLVIVDSSFTPRAIIEFKKDTRGNPISREGLSNYYPRPDGRKYDRLALFRDYLTDSAVALPIVVLYYSVIQSTRRVKLECIDGAAGRLKATHSELVWLPSITNEESCRDFVASLLGMINYET